MQDRDRPLTTEQKALALNLDPYKYGTIVEIGAGQEVAREFFKVGAASGTVAKTMSAYDMQVSDDIYGQAERYVSRGRLMQMLEKEFALVVRRLAGIRPRNTTFFAYADTVTVRSYAGGNECHGWIGIRLQLHPGAEPSDIILHVRMLDAESHSQSQALGIVGVNLIYGAFYDYNSPHRIVEGLRDNLGSDRIEADLIHFAGPYFEEIDNRLMNLRLIRSWLNRAVIYGPDGDVVVPGELFYKKPILVIRGMFKPITKVNVDMIESGREQFCQVAGVEPDQIVTLAEITMNTLISGDDVDDSDFLARIDLLASLGYTVMVSDYLRYFRLRAYLRRHTQKQIGIVLSVLNFDELFDEKYYTGLEGGILEAFGKLFPDRTHVYVYPARAGESSELTTLKTVEVPRHAQHLLAHLVDNGRLIDLERFDDRLLHIDPRAVIAELRKGRGTWEDMVPPAVAQQIIERKLFGFDSQ